MQAGHPGRTVRMAGAHPGLGCSRMAARLGIEPRQTDSESVVLPLHHRAVAEKRCNVGRGWGGSSAFFVYSARGAAGAGSRIRTDDLRFTKPLHYHCAMPASEESRKNWNELI